jgi:putative endonuclease
MMLTELFDRVFSPGARGAQAERLAERFLLKRGLTLLARNFRCRFGEIDLIMREGETLVFVEVRLRRSGQERNFGGPAASITPRKQARIAAAAQQYLAGLQPTPPCRFDAVLLNQLAADEIEWLKDAFTL